MLARRTVAGLALAVSFTWGAWGPPAWAQHHHHHPAPHGGTLVELGKEAAHLELVLDRRAGGLTVYVLDGEAQRAVRVAQTELDVHVNGPDAGARTRVVLRASANVLTGETVGNSSQFTGAHDLFTSAGVVRGTVGPVTVRGTTYPALAFSMSAAAARK